MIFHTLLIRPTIFIIHACMNLIRNFKISIYFIRLISAKSAKIRVLFFFEIGHYISSTTYHFYVRAYYSYLS